MIKARINIFPFLHVFPPLLFPIQVSSYIHVNYSLLMCFDCFGPQGRFLVLWNKILATKTKHLCWIDASVVFCLLLAVVNSKQTKMIILFYGIVQPAWCQQTAQIVNVHYSVDCFKLFVNTVNRSYLLEHHYATVSPLKNDTLSCTIFIPILP